jgi:type 1 glutamine amidotransferase
MKKQRTILVLGALLLAAASPSIQAEGKLKALIVDGQNNHDWKATTPVLRWILEDSGRFTVDLSTTPPAAPNAPRLAKDATAQQQAAHEAAMVKWKAEKAEVEKTNTEAWKQWRPKFGNYDVMVMNYTGDRWPDEVRAGLTQYIQKGGGLVIFHAANNAFPDWPEFNEMIGVGGWGGRNEKSGPMIRWRDGKIVRDETPGAGGTHGPAHEFVVEIRDSEHPITKGLPTRWMHASDELYSKLRGPAKNLTVLATAYADPAKKGTGEHEPLLMTLTYGKGRIFHDALGHGPKSMVDVGFIVTLQRGTEWAATGKVTLPPPKSEDMSADKIMARKLPE